MKTLLKIATLIVAAVIAAPAVAETAETIGAPFGLQWGQSQANLEAAGMTFRDCYEVDGFTNCFTKNPPKPISFAGNYWLSFHSTAGLQQVGAGGSWNAERQAEIKLRLTKKYGEPKFDEGNGEPEFDEVKRTVWQDGFGNYIGLVVQKSGKLTIVYTTGEYQNLVESHKNRKAEEANRNDDNL